MTLDVRAAYRIDVGLGGYDAFQSARVDPFARWKLNEPVGPGFADSSLTASFPLDSLTLGSGDPVTGMQSPYATDSMGCSFTGTEVLSAGVVALSFLSGGSIAGWFKTSYSAAEQTIAGKMTVDGKGWRITVQTNGTLRFLIQNNVPTTILDVSTNASYADGEWHRFYLTWTGNNTANGFKWYVDGVLDRQATASAVATAANGDPFLIGAYSVSGLLMFHGSLFDIVIYDAAVQPAATILADFQSAQWTDVSDDVMADGIRFSRGIAGNSPIDVVARPGVLIFALDNSDANSTQTPGYYSPTHDDVRAGWREHIPVRLVAEYGSPTDYPLWRGRIVTIRPTAGEDRERLVYVTAEGCLGPFLRQRLKTIAPQVNQTEDVLLQYVINAMPESGWPPGFTLDAGVLTVTYAFDQMGRGVNGYTLLQQIAQSVLPGRIYEAADGTLIYRSKGHSGTGVSTHSLDEDVIAGVYGQFAVINSFDHLYDQVRVTYHPKTVGAVDTDVLYQATTIYSVAPSSTLSITVDYVDPDNTRKTVGGTDFQSVTATTDYEAHSNPDGTGTDLTGTVAVGAFPFGSSINFTLVNPHATLTAYFVNASGDPFLQLRGRRIIDEGAVAVESDDNNPYVTFTPEGDQVYELDLPLVGDPDLARTIAYFVAGNWRGPHVDTIPLEPQTDQTELLNALQADVGAFWSVSETISGAQNLTVAVLGMDGEIVEQDLLNLSIRTGPWADLFVVP